MGEPWSDEDLKVIRHKHRACTQARCDLAMMGPHQCYELRWLATLDAARARPEAGTVDSVDALIDKAWDEVHALCTGKRKWTMCVPVMATDSDEVIGNALGAARKALAAAQTARETAERALSKYARHLSDCRQGSAITRCLTCGDLLDMPRRPCHLNADQWEAEKAGDWYCARCSGDRGNNGRRYYWESELPKEPCSCGLAVLLAPPAAPEPLTHLGVEITREEADRISRDGP